MSKESDFERELMEDLDEAFPGCMVIKGASMFRQGVPDRILLCGKNWAALEVKPDPKAATQPNQPWYVEKMNDMSYAAIITPENKQEVISEIQAAFRVQG